jgi:mannose-1-phosphate guanylyltransferase
MRHDPTGTERWAVVLAGGVGSRFWPLSTPERPKQLLPLASDQPMLVDAVDRLRPLVGIERVLVLTNASLADAVAGVLPDLPAGNIIAEPRPAGTAAALAWAAEAIRRRAGDEAVMISVHADWAIGDVPAFQRALDVAAEAAVAHRSLVTVGIVPSRPDPGFGYIEPGDDVEPGVRRVRRFVEKPDRERAQAMVRDGCLWNSGIFVWRVGDLLDDVRRHTPEVSGALAAHGGSIADFFSHVTSVSIDVGVMERSGRVLVVPGDFGWDDVGTWGALHRVRGRDADGNTLTDGSVAHRSHGNVVHATGARVVLHGVDDLVVVVREGVVLVTTREGSTDLKSLLDALPVSLREGA